MAIEEAGSTFNAAGYWTVGVTKGVLRVAVPIFAFSIIAGFTFKVVKMGTRLGGA